MEIDNIVNNWFEDTVAQINAANKPDESVYNLCSSILPVARNYCNATLLLLNEDKRLPAMALIRVLCELTFRLQWCVFPNKQNEHVNVRIKRWLKWSYNREKKDLERRLNLAENQEKTKIKENIKYLETEIQKIPYNFAGDLYGSLESLTYEQTGDGEISLSWKDHLYPILYTPFNQAIHPDLVVLSKLIKQSGNQRMFFGDYTSIDIATLKIYCVSCVYNIIVATRMVYELQYEEINQEYLKIKKKHAKEM